LKRNKNLSSILLSCFYILLSIGLIFTPIRFGFLINPVAYILYLLGVFLINFSMIFLLLFILNLSKLQSRLSTKTLLIIAFFYGLILLFTLLLPGGITLNEETQWYPVYSWSFFIIISFVITGIIICPFLFYSFKTYKLFKEEVLKRKIKLFFSAVIILFIGWYGAALYNTWDNSVYRSIWSVTGFIIVVISSVLIYYSMGRNI